METQKNLVIIGDSACGKTSLIQVFDNKHFPEKHIPTLFHDYFMDVKVNCTDLKLVISDTSGEKEECKWFPLQ